MLFSKSKPINSKNSKNKPNSKTRGELEREKDKKEFDAWVFAEEIEEDDD